jgi:hypothetical protein
MDNEKIPITSNFQQIQVRKTILFPSSLYNVPGWKYHARISPPPRFCFNAGAHLHQTAASSAMEGLALGRAKSPSTPTV